MLTYLFRTKVLVLYCQKEIDMYVIYSLRLWHIQQEAEAPLPLQSVQRFSSKATVGQVQNGYMHSESVP